MNHRKGLSAIITIILLLLLLHVNIFAVPMNFDQDDSQPVMQYIVNPLYRESAYALATHPYLGRDSVSTFALRPTFDNIYDAAAYVRSEMKDRNESIEFYYSGPEGAMDILNETYEHTGVPDEGENLMFNWTSCSYTDKNFGSSYYGIYFTYLTSLEQERELTEKITATLASMNLDGKSEYEKIEAIYSWICSNVEYDHLSAVQIENNITPSNPYNQTAYGAMCLGTSVCNGFALLCYRMMLKAGIDCRYINGTLHGVGHAWNIVKLDGNYYVLDATNGSSDVDYNVNRMKAESGGGYTIICPKYDFFLRGKTSTDSFSMYIPQYYVWNEKYNSKEFNVRYPISETDYTGQHIHDMGPDIMGGYTQEPTCTEVGYSNAVCKCGKAFENGIVFAPYGHYYDNSGLCLRCGTKKPSYLPESGKFDVSSMLGKSFEEIFGAFKEAFSGKDVQSQYVTPPDYTISVAVNEYANYTEGFTVTASMEDSTCTNLHFGTYFSYDPSNVPNPMPEVSLMDCLKGYSNVTLCYDIPVAIAMDELEKELTSKGIKYIKEEKSSANVPGRKSVTISPIPESMPNGYYKSCYWMYDYYSQEFSGASALLKTFTPGDVNNDGKVTLDDAVLTLKRTMNVDLGSATFIAEAAEVTGDGQLTLEDAIGVLKLAMKVQ